MPTDSYDDIDMYDDQGNPDPQQPNQQRDDYLVRVPRSQIRQLQERAKSGGDSTARAEAAERELAFAKAGIDLSSKDAKVQFFTQGYQGEMTAEAIKAQAEAFGVLETQPAGDQPSSEAQANVNAGLSPEGDTPLEPGEAAQGSESAALRQGSQPDQPVPVDPLSEARSAYNTALDNGAQEGIALGGALNTLVNAAAQGDQRVIIPNPRSGAGRSES